MLAFAAVASGQHLYRTNQQDSTPQHTAQSNTSGGSGSGQSAGATPTPTSPGEAPPPTVPPKAPAPVAAPAPTAQPKAQATAPAPTPSPPPAPAPTPAGSEYATEAECPGQSNVGETSSVLVCLTSHARIYNGLGTISANTPLMNSAAHKATDIATCEFSHTACGRTFGYWITADGYGAGCYAENIAQGQQTPIEVFTAWMNSAGHRANILHASYKDIGVAYLANSDSPIWVMHLGGC